MINFIKKLIPVFVLNLYHRVLAILANWRYGRPSEKMIIIGVTGTNGKTSTCDFIAKVLEGAGYKVGLASTAMFKIDDKEWLNDKKMTMLGRFSLQKLLKQMTEAGCRYAIIETSSQGIEQFRHLGIHYDICVFTNLTPEHIEAHGGFNNYKKAKLKLFKHLEKLPVKNLGGEKIIKTIIVNGDDKYAKEFLNFKVDQKITFGLGGQAQLKAKSIVYQADGVSFDLNDQQFDLKLFGQFNVYNCLAALAVAKSQQINLAVAKSALEKITVVPGRMEFVETGRDFKVLVDYAPEPESLKQLFATIKAHGLADEGKIIHVFGSCGGGRDVSRRPILGELSAKQAEVQIVTNEDPYDDDPQAIINEVAEGAIKAGQVLKQNLFKVLDRREAIKLALSLAQAGDLVLLTGKGCEQTICVKGGEKIPWDERQVVKEELKKL